MDTATLTQILAKEVAAYAGEMLNGLSFFTASPDNHLFAVIDISIQAGKRYADAGLIARIDGTNVIIEHDMNDEPLVDALVQAGVPREQIVLGYIGEPFNEAA
jgi:hypothetical protein